MDGHVRLSYGPTWPLQRKRSGEFTNLSSVTNNFPELTKAPARAGDHVGEGRGEFMRWQNW